MRDNVRYLAQSRHRLCAPHMSALGAKRTSAVLHCTCPLMTQSGHQPPTSRVTRHVFA